MASGDVVLEVDGAVVQTTTSGLFDISRPGFSVRLNKPDASPNNGFTQVELTRAEGPVSNENTPFDMSKTYDVIIKEH